MMYVIMREAYGREAVGATADRAKAEAVAAGLARDGEDEKAADYILCAPSLDDDASYRRAYADGVLATFEAMGALRGGRDE